MLNTSYNNENKYQRKRVSEFIKNYSQKSLTLGCILYCSDKHYLDNFLSKESVFLDFVKDRLNITLTDELKDDTKYYTNTSFFKLSYDEDIDDRRLVYLYLEIPTETLFKPSSKNSLFMNKLGLAFEGAVEQFISDYGLFDELAVNKSAESYQEHIKENININGKSIKFFSGYDIEKSLEVYNFYGYFAALYLNKDILDLFTADEQTYNSVIEEFRKNIINAVNESLKKLGNEDIKYDIHPVSEKYSFQPTNFEYKGPWSRGSDKEYENAIRNLNDSKDDVYSQIDFKALVKSVLSILKSKYKNFEDVFRTYGDCFSCCENSGNIEADLLDYIKYNFTSRLEYMGVDVLDKKAFYDFLVNGTKSDSDKDLILDTFCALYNESLNSNVKLGHFFEGKYSDFIEGIDDSTLSKAKKNNTSLLYFNNYEGKTFIGVNICVKHTVRDLLDDEKISRDSVKTLCNSLLREIVKN